MPPSHHRPSFLQRRRSNFRPSSDWGLRLAIITAVAFLLLGGGAISAGPQAVLMILLGSACVLYFGAKGGFRSAIALPTIELLCIAAIVAIPLVQLIPLPPALWAQLPGRETETQILVIVGQSTAWRPLTLDLAATLSTLAFTLALGGIFLAGLTLTDRAVRVLLFAIAACAALSILVGAMQLSTAGRLMTFYPSLNRDLLLGFMANRNHQALFIAIGILISGYLISRSRAPERQHLAIFGIVAFVSFAAAFGTASRMGLALCLVASFAAPFLFLGAKMRHRNAIIGVGITIALFVGLTLVSGSAGRALDRYGDVGTDYRWTIWERSITIAPTYFPAGSGIGSFADVYKKYEKLEWLLPQYVNAAHNDYLQLFLEGGLLGIIALALLAATLVRAALIHHPIDRHGRRGPTTLAKLGLAIIFLILVHSVVDYPLRRPAIGAIFALALALTLRQRLIAFIPHQNALNLPQD